MRTAKGGPVPRVTLRREDAREVERLGTNGHFVGGGSYRGSWDAFGMSGAGTYVTPHKAVLEGEFHDGQFHGNGALKWPRGQTLHGFWVSGRLTRGTENYVFRDGLTFRPIGWDYCQFPDRRFYECVSNGLRPAGRTLKASHQPTRLLPPSRYDVGFGVFDPSTYRVTRYHDPSKVLEIPTEAEAEWIKENCRKGRWKPTGHVDWLHRRWALGTYDQQVPYVLARSHDSPEKWWRRFDPSPYETCSNYFKSNVYTRFED